VSKAKNGEPRYHSGEEVILKGKERDYNHFVNVSNGKNIHYYRACDATQKEMQREDGASEGKEDGIKMEDLPNLSE
jgi:hypothetical protein